MTPDELGNFKRGHQPIRQRAEWRRVRRRSLLIPVSIHDSCGHASSHDVLRSDRWVTEHHTLAEVAKRVPMGIVCLLTALRFHGLGTQNPRDVWLAVDRRAGIPKIGFTPVRAEQPAGLSWDTVVQETVP